MDNLPQTDQVVLQIKKHPRKWWLGILVSSIAYIIAPFLGMGYLFIYCVRRYLWPSYKSYLAFSFSAQLGLALLLIINLFIMFLANPWLQYFTPKLIPLVLTSMGLLLLGLLYLYYSTAKMWAYILLSIINLSDIFTLYRPDDVLHLIAYGLGLIFRLLIVFTLWMGWFKERPLMEPKAHIQL